MSVSDKRKIRRITRKSLEYNFNYIMSGPEFQKYIKELPNYDELVEDDIIDEEDLESISSQRVIKNKDAKKFLEIFITSIIKKDSQFTLPIKIILVTNKRPNMLIAMSKNSIYIPIKIGKEFINLSKIRLSYEQNNILSFLKRDEVYTMLYYSSFNNLEISKYLHDTLLPSFDESTELIKYADGESTYSYIDIYTRCIELTGMFQLSNIIFLIADISITKLEPSPLIISKGFKKSKDTYGFVVFVDNTRTKIKYSHLVSLNKTSKKTKKKSKVSKFNINFNLKQFNTQILDLLKFNRKKLLKIRDIEDKVLDVPIKKSENLRIKITDNSLLEGIEFILGPEKRRKIIKDNRILSDIMYENSEGDTLVMGEFRGPLRTDETDDLEKDCKIIWNESGNTFLTNLFDKL